MLSLCTVDCALLQTMQHLSTHHALFSWYVLLIKADSKERLQELILQLLFAQTAALKQAREFHSNLQ